MAVHGCQAGEASDDFALSVNARERWPSFAPNPFRGCVRAELRRVGRSQDAKMTVDVADASKAGDDLLSDVATFGGADGVRFETCLGWEGVGSDVDPPQGKSAGDTQGLPVG